MLLIFKVIYHHHSSFQNVALLLMEINGNQPKISCEKDLRLHDECFPNSFTIF